MSAIGAGQSFELRRAASPLTSNLPADGSDGTAGASPAADTPRWGVDRSAPRNGCIKPDAGDIARTGQCSIILGPSNQPVLVENSRSSA